MQNKKTKNKDLKDSLKGMKVRELKKIILNLSSRLESKKKQLSKDQIKTRDGNKCLLCEDTNDLEVHHIKPALFRKNEKDGLRITLCRYCHWYLHSNPKFTIYNTDLIKQSMIKIKGKTFSKNGAKWGRKQLHTDGQVIALHKEGMIMRKIAKKVYYFDKQDKKKFVSLGYVHKIIKKHKKDMAQNKYIVQELKETPHKK